MKKQFAIGVLGLILFEIANVYFIMPLPGSQRMRSIEVAYWLHSYRWWLRLAFCALIVLGAPAAWRVPGWRKALVPFALIVALGVSYMTNFRMAADQIFLPPQTLVMQPAERNAVALDRLVVGIALNGEARAYPLQFIGYHHQVRDTVGGQQVLVTYCTVCRTGRVYTPLVNGKPESFRLVGMDHFNAMLEDETTGSWWRQANGEAVVGELKGMTLEEVPSVQVTLAQWLALHPASLVMQADEAFIDAYAADYAFERGTSRGALTGTDTLSWRDKSWVVGLTVNGESRAYDWNRLLREHVIHDELGGAPIVLVLAGDNTSFFAFERPNATSRFALSHDSLVTATGAYDLTGRGATNELRRLRASQEFWHSWRTFQPNTTRY